MRKFLKVLSGKKLLGVLLLLVQLAIFYMGFYALREYSWYIFGGERILGAVVILIIVNRDTDSGFKISWLFLIAVMPVFGISLYFYVRVDIPAGKIRDELRRIHDTTVDLNENDDYELALLNNEKSPDAGIFNYLHKHGDYPPYSNTLVKYMPLGDDAFPVMLDELRKASKFIFIEYFIINDKSEMWQEIYRILRDKIHEGVEVRVVYDGMGSMLTVSPSFAEKLQRHGIQCMAFAPVKPFLSTYQNNRDHRKIIVIDGKTAFSGGINLSDEYINRRKLYGHWKDNAVMIKGDAVKSFTIMFLRMWNVISGKDENYHKYVNEKDLEHRNLADGHVAPFDDSPFRSERVGKNVYTDIINSARDYVYIMTPYLVLDESMREALKYASKRGVDVKIMMPHIPDKWYAFALARTYYPELIPAGIEIYEYTHGFVHSKTTVSDDVRAVVGTINYDYRSLYLHYECGVYLAANSAIKDIKADFDNTLQKCKLFTIEDYHNSSFFMRLFGRILRVFAPLM